jgi:hypothetical protein
MNKMNWFDMSLAWKFFSVIVLIAFVLIGVILVFMRVSFMKILGIELGVIIAWLIGMVGYAILAYFVRHTRRP